MTAAAARPALIYNLFPLLAGPFTEWRAHVARAAELGSTDLFVNPIHQVGQSGSLYAVADYFAFNPLLVDPQSPLAPADQVREAIRVAERAGYPEVLVMWKASSRGAQEALLVFNEDIEHRQSFSTRDLRAFVQSGAPLADSSPGRRLDHLPTPFSYELEPGQGLVLVTPEAAGGARKWWK